jgi:hypothetical protein
MVLIDTQRFFNDFAQLITGHTSNCVQAVLQIQTVGIFHRCTVYKATFEHECGIFSMAVFEVSFNGHLSFVYIDNGLTYQYIDGNVTRVNNSRSDIYKRIIEENQ